MTSFRGGYDVACLVKIECSGYTAKHSIYITTGELFQFYLQLKDCYDYLKGRASFTEYEGRLSIDVAFQELGHVVISGCFIANPGNETELKFEMRTDQSFIPEAIDGLADIHQRYGGMRRIEENH